MTSEAERAHWELLQRHFEEALERPVADRRAWLAEAVADPEVRAEVASLLEGHEGEGRLDGLSSALASMTEASPSAADEPDPPPERVGPYEVLERLGWGGMGTVLLARRVDEPGAEAVALKLLRGDQDTERVRRRFLVEREILARIEHPRIARTLDDGFTAGGLPYFVMEYVDGEPIDVYCDGHELGVRPRVELFASVCSAVAHAHGLGVVHRDLKPENILVTADGDVRLLDFGIAKIVEGTAFGTLHRRTTTGVRLLTPEYASPEQLVGGEVTPASDQYQLGLLLYRLLADHLPPVVARVRSRVPGGATAPTRLVAPSVALGRGGATAGSVGRTGPGAYEIARVRGLTVDALQRALEGSLDAITLKALREQPEERYASVAALDADVRSYLSGADVAAEPAAPERTGRGSGRARPGPLLWAAGVGVLIALATAVWSIL